MAKNVTYVARDKFEALITSAGLKFIEQAGYLKVPCNGRAVYVAKAKNVGRVDISGFCPSDILGVKVLSAGERFCRVQAQINFSLTEAEILGAFDSVLSFMKTIPAETSSEKKARKAAQARPGKVKPAFQQVMKTSMSNADTLALIERVAREKGVKVSPKAYEQYGAQAQ